MGDFEVRSAVQEVASQLEDIDNRLTAIMDYLRYTYIQRGDMLLRIDNDNGRMYQLKYLSEFHQLPTDPVIEGQDHRTLMHRYEWEELPREWTK